MANLNPEDPNIPNEDVPEEDPYHLLDFDEEEDLEMDIEEEEPEEDPIEEPKPLAGHGDQFDAHPNPQPRNMNGWVDDHDDGDQTRPPEDESSDYEFEAEEADDEHEVEEAGVEPEAERVDVELEAEEPDGAPEATIGTGSQRPFANVLESGENETLKKKLDDKEMLLDLTRMDRDRAERRLFESIWWNERFYLEMVHKGAVPKPPSYEEGSERPRKMPKKSDGDERPSDPCGPLMIMPPKAMSEARMREIIRDQFATSMNEFMANINNEAGGSGGAGGFGGTGRSGGIGGNAGGGGNAGRTGVRGARPTVPELTGCTYVTFTKCDPLPFNGTRHHPGHLS
nr:hypothetical protein [Tanacetum cinerariifolium]